MSKKKYLYVVLNYFIQGMNVVLNLLMMRVLSPSELGIISLSKVFFQGSEYMHFGTRFSLDRYLPVKNDLDSKLYLYTAISLYLVVAFLYIFFVFLFFYDNPLYVLFSLSGTLFVTANFIKIYHRSKSDYSNLNTTTFFLMVVPLASQIILLLIYGFKGFILGFILGYFLSFLLVIYNGKNLIKFFSINTVWETYKKKLAKPGFLLFLSGLTSFAAMSVDRIIVGSFVSLELLGYYSVVLFFVTMYLILPSTISELVLPNIIQHANKRGCVKLLSKYIILTLTLSFFLGLGVLFTISDVIEFIAPEYISLTKEIIFSLFILIPYSITPFLLHFLNALDKQFNMMILNVVTFLVYMVILAGYVGAVEVSLLDLVHLKIFYFTMQSCLVVTYVLWILKKELKVL